MLVLAMQVIRRELNQPFACRIWDPARKCFSFTDGACAQDPSVDRWTGLFDRQGLPLYERDIIRAHYDWKLGWVSGLIVRHPERAQFAARATAATGAVFYLGFYCFADAYLAGNLHQHPGKLRPACEQFQEQPVQPWWLSEAVFGRTTRLQHN